MELIYFILPSVTPIAGHYGQVRVLLIITRTYVIRVIISADREGVSASGGIPKHTHTASLPKMPEDL